MPPPPPPHTHFHRIRGYPMHIPSHGIPRISYLGKTDGPFYMLFHIIISTPFLGNFSQLTPYIGNIMVTPIPFLLYFLLAREICVRILPLPSRAPTTDMRCNKGPIPFLGGGGGGYWRLGNLVRINHIPYFLISREASEKHPISREIDLKTSLFPFFSGKSSRDKRPKIPPFPSGNAHAAPLYIRGGGAGLMFTDHSWFHKLSCIDINISSTGIDGIESPVNIVDCMCTSSTISYAVFFYAISRNLYIMSPSLNNIIAK